MHSDPIADLLTRIRNAARANHYSASISYSKIKEEILKIMKKYQFIEDYTVEGEKVGKTIEVTLRTDKKDIHLKRVSKPGQRIYLKNIELKPVRSGLGLTIISTSKGLMTNFQAKKQNLGGEVLCEIY